MDIKLLNEVEKASIGERQALPERYLRLSDDEMDARIAAPTTGPAAIPRKVRAPTTPSARGRDVPPKRWAAAAVPTGTSTPPPIAWTSRAPMS